MRAKTKAIITLVVAIFIFLIFTFSLTFYTLYKYGEKNNLLEEEETVDLSRYRQEKALLDDALEQLELDEKILEQEYVDRHISYEEYERRKEQLEKKEEELHLQEENLERKYDIDD